MSAYSLRLDAAALDNHSRRCDDVADRLAARNLAMQGLLDHVVALHVRSTWDSPTATERRHALKSRRDAFEAVRSDLASLVVQLRARAEADRLEARMLVRRAEAIEADARLEAIEAQQRRVDELTASTGPR
jgi:DNA-binding FrmR family transcriptional regulator